MLAGALLSATLNLVVLAGLPFLLYAMWLRFRCRLGLREIADRAGLRQGQARYIGYGLVLALFAMILLVIWRPPLAPFLRPGSAERIVAGLDLKVALPIALLYGVVQSGLTEEVLFRGLIAGSLGRRMPLAWANLSQAAIFLLPHLLILRLIPGMWGILPVIFLLGLIAGWLRIQSGSIVGGWIIHSVINVTMCLSVALRTTHG